MWKTQEALGLIVLFNEGYLCIDHNWQRLPFIGSILSINYDINTNVSDGFRNIY